MELSHREQKKLQTRQALIKSAMTLFTEQGFDNTSLAQITERANCAPRTFFLYFESKEDLVPAAIELGANQLKDALQKRESGRDTVDVLRTWMMQGLQNHDSKKAQEDPAFEIRKQYHLAKYLEPIFTEAFASDLGVDETSVEPRLLAASAIGMLSSFSFALSGGERRSFLECAARLLEDQVEHLKHQ